MEFLATLSLPGALVLCTAIVAAAWIIIRLLED